jgi:hypothetical protein
VDRKIQRSISQPLRNDLSWDQRWKGKDQGLIQCWEVGRQLSETDPSLAANAVYGELPMMTWKGGVEKKLKVKEKYGTLRYLAQWQGLRGEDLDIDLSREYELICTRTNMKVVFTGDANKHSETA